MKSLKFEDKHLDFHLNNKFCVPEGVHKNFIIVIQVVAEKTLTKKGPNVFYRSDRRKN